MQGNDEEHHDIDVTNGTQTRNAKWQKTPRAHAAFWKWRSVTDTKAGLPIQIDNNEEKCLHVLAAHNLKGAYVGRA